MCLPKQNDSMLKVNSQKLIVNKSGFSALEMLLALGLIVLLLGAAVLVGFRDQPAKNRNTERRNEVNAIKDALTQWSLDTGTYMPAGTPASGLSEVPRHDSAGTVATLRGDVFGDRAAVDSSGAAVAGAGDPDALFGTQRAAPDGGDRL